MQNKWDETIDNTDFPALDDLIVFLRRWAARSSIKPSTSQPTKKPIDIVRQKRNTHQGDSGAPDAKRGRTKPRPQTFATTSQTPPNPPKPQKKCYHCEDLHAITACSKFKDLSERNRFNRAKELRICINCLKGPHKSSDCRYPPCSKCSKKHHTMLHFSQPAKNESQD